MRNLQVVIDNVTVEVPEDNRTEVLQRLLREFRERNGQLFLVVFEGKVICKSEAKAA